MSALMGVIAAGRQVSGSSEYVGYNVVGGSVVAMGNTVIAASAKFTAPFNGTITEFGFYCSCDDATQDIKLGLYTDSGGNPSALVGTEVEFVNVGTWSVQWKTWTGMSWSVTSGQTYWLAAMPSVSNAIEFHFDVTGSGRKSDSHAYGNAWPATFDVNSSSGAQYCYRALLTP